uniref:HNH endonuclease n=1 Tax=Enterococcus mundtii TaxID=53346 RepID=UPI000825D9F2
KKKNKNGSYSQSSTYFKCITLSCYEDLDITEESKQFIVDFFSKKFDSIIKSPLDQLIEIEEIFYRTLIKYEDKELAGVKTAIDKKLENIMGYKNFSNNSGVWNALEFCKCIEVNTCPYCNLQFTYSIDENNKSIRPHLDHFYPKSKHPILSMSLYNLVPSCYTCNSSLKRDIEPLEILDWYPYDNDIYSKFNIKRTFDSDIKDFYSALLGYSDEYTLDFYTKEDRLKESLNKFIDLFFLKERYSMHKTRLNKELVNFFSYSSSYMKSLDQAYDFGLTYDQLINSFITNDYDDYVLSKLINDIILEEQKFIY